MMREVYESKVASVSGCPESSTMSKRQYHPLVSMQAVTRDRPRASVGMWLGHRRTPPAPAVRLVLP